MTTRKTGRPRATRQVHRLPLTQARINLGAVVRQARLHKDCFVLEKDGIPVAALMDIDEFEDYLELQDPEVRRHLRESARDYAAGRSRPAAAFLEALARAPKRTGRRARPA
jgi:PHD/YefM family antitoxin component YafN of YafNO toxin-antitoxin module